MVGLTLLLMHASLVAATHVNDLRCEYLKSPNCVDSTSPRLSWITSFEGKNWHQSAYRILVASSTKLLSENRGDLWDSGKIASSQSIQIPYAGNELKSNEQCFWKVQVWDQTDEASPWSNTDKWSMGLLSEGDWGGSSWIGLPTGLMKGNAAPYLRKLLRLSGKVRRATLFACGLGYAEIHLNGKKLGENVERDPGYTNFDKRVLYVAHDVTQALRQGENLVGAILGTGWYDVHDLATWRFEKAPWRARPKLRLILLIDYEDGHRETVASDNSWKASTGPILSDGIYTGELYDARLEMPGWDLPGYDDHSWGEAAAVEAPKGKLAARPCPPVAITETIKPVRILNPKSGVYVVDFGQNISGHARIRVQGPAGSEITMRYSERILGDGSIDRHQIDVFMTKQNPPQPFQTDSYICSGKGVETWEQCFSYSGFRYMEVTGFPGVPQLGNFETRFAHTNLESAGEFECSNELLNKIQRATRYSYLSNAQSIPTDCPQREKNGWTGDAQLAAETGLMNFRSASFYTKWLNDLDDDQSPNGALSLIVPSGGWGHGETHPAWDSAFAIVANDLHLYRGDTRALEQHYEGIRRYVDYVAHQTKDGVVPFDSLGDWVPWSTQTPSQLTSTVFLFVDAGIVAKAARILGKTEDAEKYAALATATKEAFNEHFFQAASIDKLSQTALSMAIYFGLLDEATKQTALAALVKNLESQGHIDTGILGAKFVLRVLPENGRSDLAYKLVARKEQPGWGWWIEQGATTLWEDWKGESSLNHIMFGDVSNWFYQWIAGIGLDPAFPAFKHVLIRPQPVGELTWAKARIDGPYGRISSSWKLTGRSFELSIEIPPNSTATVIVPGACTAPEGATLKDSRNGFTVIDVGSGNYQFKATMPNPPRG